MGGGGWGAIWVGRVDAVFVVGQPGAASWERGLHLLTWRGPLNWRDPLEVCLQLMF